jgi:hypothetical protein
MFFIDVVSLPVLLERLDTLSYAVPRSKLACNWRRANQGMVYVVVTYSEA